MQPDIKWKEAFDGHVWVAEIQSEIGPLYAYAIEQDPETAGPASPHERAENLMKSAEIADPLGDPIEIKINGRDCILTIVPALPFDYWQDLNWIV